MTPISVDRSTCLRCASAAGPSGASWREARDGSKVLVLPEGADEAAARKALADLKSCTCAAADARRSRLRAVGLDERTAALALVLAQGDAAPADARALVADLSERAAKAWG